MYLFQTAVELERIGQIVKIHMVTRAVKLHLHACFFQLINNPARCLCVLVHDINSHKGLAAMTRVGFNGNVCCVGNIGIASHDAEAVGFVVAVHLNTIRQAGELSVISVITKRAVSIITLITRNFFPFSFACYGTFTNFATRRSTVLRSSRAIPLALGFRFNVTTAGGDGLFFFLVGSQQPIVCRLRTLHSADNHFMRIALKNNSIV